MKLTLLDNSAAVPTPIQPGSDATQALPKIRLRGSIFFYNPRSMAIGQRTGDANDREVETDRTTITLIYRGNTYERKLQPLPPYQKPRHLNWRWQ